jgi:hypothetical protein
MKAYNTGTLRNRAVLTQTEQWHRAALLTDAQHAAIRVAYPSDFRETNFITEVGLFVFTLIVGGGGFMLFGELFQPGKSIGWFLLIYGIGAIGAAEWLIHRHRYYRNGIDNALVIMGVVFVLYGLFSEFWPDSTFWQRCILAGVVLSIAVLRYGDPLLMIGLLGVIYGLVFERLLSTSAGQNAWPFVGMGLSAGLYWLGRRLQDEPTPLATPQTSALRLSQDNQLYYSDVLTHVDWFSLIALLVCGNYFVAQGGETFGLFGLPKIGDGNTLMRVLFWLTTFGIPLLYGFFGLRNRDRTLLILACFGMAGAVQTAHFYVEVLPQSVHWAITGAVLVLASGFLIRWLRTTKNGFTDAPDDARPDWTNVAQTLTVNQIANVQAQPPDLRFGEGSTGGGGAEGRY